MSDSWPLVPLGNLLRRVERFEARDDLKEYQFAGTYSFARGIFVGARKPGSAFRLPRVQRIREGDFVYCKIMAWEGAFGFVPREANECVMSGAFVVYEVDSALVEMKFLEYFFKVSAHWQSIGKQSTGTNVRRRSLHPTQFERAKIPLPPLSEQRRIVARIEELAAKIEEARNLQKNIWEEAEAFVTSSHMHLAAGRAKKLGEFLQLDEDTAAVVPTGSYPQVGVKSFGGGLFPKGPTMGTETTYKAFNRLYEGALILSQVKGWEGAVAICPGSLAGWFVSPEYRTFRCIDGQARPGYLAPLIRTEWFWGRLKHATRGVGARRERTRPEQFLNIEIPMPKIGQQQQGEQIFDKVDTLKKLHVETAAELETMLPSILDKAFKGKL